MYLTIYKYFQRFTSQTRYVLLVKLCGHQMDLISQEEEDKCARLAPFLGLYYAPAFLKCTLAIGASYRDLQFHHAIREYRYSTVYHSRHKVDYRHRAMFWIIKLIIPFSDSLILTLVTASWCH